MNCDDAQARYLSGEDPAPTRAHISGCSACRRALPELDRIRARLDDPDLWAVPSTELADRLVTTVAAAAVPSTPTVPGRRRGRSRWYAAIGTAAVAAVVFVAAAIAVTATDDPDWQFALQAAPDSPAAAAIVSGWNEDAGTRIELDIQGLPSTNNEWYYAVWLSAPDGRHIPAATFTGSGTVEGWVGVSRRDFPRVWITLEPNDRDESLSGTTVFDTPDP